MIKMYKKIIFFALPLFVIWLFLLAIRNNFDLSNLRINLFATIKQFENITSDDFVSYIDRVNEMFSSLNFNFDFSYVAVNDLTTFFANIGIWFNGVYNLIVEFFKMIGNVIGTLGLGIAYIGKLIINIFNFIFNPITL